jgi:hypothetical protein
MPPSRSGSARPARRNDADTRPSRKSPATGASVRKKTSVTLVRRAGEYRLASPDAERRLPAGRVEPVEHQIVAPFQVLAEFAEQPWGAADLDAADTGGPFLPAHDAQRPVAPSGAFGGLRGEQQRKFGVEDLQEPLEIRLPTRRSAHPRLPGPDRQRRRYSTSPPRPEVTRVFLPRAPRHGAEIRRRDARQPLSTPAARPAPDEPAGPVAQAPDVVAAARIWSRSARRRSLPDGVRGSDSAKRTARSRL